MASRSPLPPLPARPKDAHKSSVGRVLVVGGSLGMAGAPSLVARGALRAGAGLVTVAVPARIQDVVAGLLPEAMTLGLACDDEGRLVPGAMPALFDAMDRADAVVVGPGAGRSERTGETLKVLVLSLRRPTVLDADGLFALGGEPSKIARGRKPNEPLVLTPHEGEAVLLLGLTARLVRADRRAAAERIAKTVRGICVLKGPKTLVSDGKRTFVNATGGPVLATGGTGDVLSGVLAAFLTGCWPNGGDAVAAARLAVHVHGLAGDLLAKRVGDRGVLASEVADAIPEAIREVRRKAR